MEKLTIEQRIIAILEEELGLEGEIVTADTAFDALGVDSLDFIKVISEVEDRFGLGLIPPEALREMNTVGDLVRYVEARKC